MLKNRKSVYTTAISETPSETSGAAGAAPRTTAASTSKPNRGTGPAPRKSHGLAVWIATAGGVGFAPWAPGTWGALLAVGLFVAGAHRLGWPLFSLLLLISTLVGVWASSAAERSFDRDDDGRIVIDEVVGQWIALFPLLLLHDLPLGEFRVPGLESLSETRIDLWWALVVTAFVAFRWFDIRKPGPVKWAEQKFRRGAGVMADDIVAGGLAAAVVTLPAYVIVTSRMRDLVRDSLLAAQDFSVWLGGWLA